MKKLFIIIGWLALMSAILETIAYLDTGEISNRWGTFNGSTARDILIANIIMALIFGGYSLFETYKLFKNRKSNVEKLD